MKIKKFLLEQFLNFLSLLPPSLCCILNNVRMKFMGRKIYFSYIKKKNFFKVDEDNYSIYFPEKMRGINTYSYGIKARAVSLAKTYNLELVDFTDGDTLIDCGANFGDIYTWTKIKKLKINYISFEPSPAEFDCVELNCKNQKNNNFALSDISGEVFFFINSAEGDSSIIEPASGYTKKIKVKSIRLDDYVVKNSIDFIKFLKIEAEGCEPEVLKGAKNILERIEYIGVDGSPERGLKSEATIDYAIDFLEKNNFKIIKSNINNSFSKVLFKNKQT